MFSRLIRAAALVAALASALGCSTADESTQTNGFSDPHAGELNKKELEAPTQWSVESGMS